MGRRSSNYPPELRERAVRMVAQVRPEYPSDWPAICAVAEKLGIGTAETLRKWVIGLYKTELIKPQGPWRTAEQVELATLDYVDWFNHRRLYETCGDIPPAELETIYYRQNTSLAEAG